MKKMNLLLLIILPFTLLCQEKLILDIKVPILETADLAPAQMGATLFLLQSDWATVSDVGETVSVWLKEYDRRKNILGQQVISCTLEVREPSLIRKGNLKETKKIVVRYWDSPTKSESYNTKILNDLKDLSDDLKIEAYHIGQKIEKELKELLK